MHETAILWRGSMVITRLDGFYYENTERWYTGLQGKETPR